MRCALALGLTLCALAWSATALERTEAREDCSAHDPLRQPFFGDTHVHTGFSFDAWGQGTLPGPDEAYRFAKGEPIGLPPWSDGRPGDSVALRRPLDWAIVTDHSDLLGETRICQTPGAPGYGSIVCRVVRHFPGLGYVLVNGHVYASESPRRYSFCGEGGRQCLEAARGPWRETRRAAEAHYDRSAACRFTTFVGYEWTGMPGGRNLHRNVVFRNDVAQEAPTTYIETPTPEGLWQALERECLEAPGKCDVLAIPHNSNVSGGLMFAAARSGGAPLDEGTARTRARLERLVEITQHKGDSECGVGAGDELCSYETLPFEIMSEMATPRAWGEPIPEGSYVRDALVDGLALGEKLGVNPFRFGLIGSTDTHLATPGMVDEDRHIGHAAGLVNARHGIPPFPDAPFFNPGGLAVLWAEENSRDALFEAMHRREAYGTSGPRIRVRFFGGFELPQDLCGAPDFAARGYAAGVPMGGVLRAPATASPLRFAVWALRDPDRGDAPSTPLQRIQIVKGWLEDGETRVRVLDVAGRADPTAGVDLATCRPHGPGADQLCAVWEDPEHDPTRPAVYYARVVENPSCRWSQYVCNRHGVDCTAAGGTPAVLEPCCDPELARTIQERAWTSPIWVDPR